MNTSKNIFIGFLIAATPMLFCFVVWVITLFSFNFIDVAHSDVMIIMTAITTVAGIIYPLSNVD